MSRPLVEAVTHTDALHSLAQQLGPKWLAHYNSLSGRGFAERGQASQVLIDRDEPLNGLSFPRQLGLDTHVQTRLGQDDHTVFFKPAFTSPFGCKVSELRIPHWLLLGAKLPDDLEDAADVVTTPTQTTFRFGTFHFAYDRCGLRRL
jgi:hypothetical protein